MPSFIPLRGLSFATVLTAALVSTGDARAGEAEAPAGLDANVTRSTSR
jgi:hypothetical protein